MERQSDDAWFCTLALTLHLDISRKTDFPLGFMAGYKYMSAQDPEGMDLKGSQGADLNISYAGRQDFTFGIDFTYEKVPLQSAAEDANVLSALASLSYYF